MEMDLVDLKTSLLHSISENIQLVDQMNVGGYDLDALNAYIYAVPREADPDFDEENKKQVQARFFKNTYNLMIGKAAGPRLYLFLYAVDPSRYLPLLDFSTAQTEDEVRLAEEARIEAERAAAERAAAEEAARLAALKEEEEKNKIDPVKDQITLDDFDKVDMRVCKVLACEIVKKARNLLKLTLSDGLGERVIVSSIRNDYKPEDLIGKKIIVIANLKPAKFAGITSNGMLVAASGDSFGCKVIFVDDSVPEGTAIH